MKTSIFAFLIIFCLSVNGYSQNRIHGWDIEKITSIQVEYSVAYEIEEFHVFNSKQDIDRIMSFLKNVDFKVFTNSNTLEQANSRQYKILFQGQRDQVYLFEHSACIGKTSFVIDNSVFEGFRNLLKEL